jgi:hypothetical protein
MTAESAIERLPNAEEYTGILLLCSGGIEPRKSYSTLALLRLSGDGIGANVDALQRLFSMFPAGAPGFGLLILRLCAAGMLFRNAQPITAPTIWMTVVLFVLVVALSIGVFTPVVCIASSLAQVVLLIRAPHEDTFEMGFSVGVVWALFLLGPGAFSVDGRRFGRRRIHLPNSK